MALWTVAEGQNEDGIRLIRDQIKTIRFLGNGNFGQVYHAVYGPLRTEVAVKSLRGTFHFFLSTFTSFSL